MASPDSDVPELPNNEPVPPVDAKQALEIRKLRSELLTQKLERTILKESRRRWLREWLKSSGATGAAVLVTAAIGLANYFVQSGKIEAQRLELNAAKDRAEVERLHSEYKLDELRKQASKLQADVAAASAQKVKAIVDLADVSKLLAGKIEESRTAAEEIEAQRKNVDSLIAKRKEEESRLEKLEERGQATEEQLAMRSERLEELENLERTRAQLTKEVVAGRIILDLLSHILTPRKE